ncbi:CsgG/HfaB family protein [Aureivirga sp. CE67]|uniref:CsgG/HfaB family protein n=1 Tax=Aureivirga sp. CE67 TaxID=1788983 RepID=UPI0018CB0841|nr:CsgG/HfaB family protein [Aureivirga sp. CE67]
MKIKSIIGLVFIGLLSGCGAYWNQPLQTQKARIGENTPKSELLKDIKPQKPIVVAVYKFRDQTGQYKQLETGSTWSTSVTQGGTSILIKSLADSKWFSPIERENIGNLFNERQIIRSTRVDYANVDAKNSLHPLLYAGVILEGGVVSYDSNIMTGGVGARYFGAGGAANYRQDRITVYLRAVSTMNGQILKNVYVSKTILSQQVTASLFRYVNLQRLLEVETGYTQNEPSQLAVKEAIDKAVELMIVEGILDGLWSAKGGDESVALLKERFEKEKEEAENTKIYNRNFQDRRAKNGISFEVGTSRIENDYANPANTFSFALGYNYYLKNPSFSLAAGMRKIDFKNKNLDNKQNLLSVDANLQFNVLPYEKFTPYVYVGPGYLFNIDKKDNANEYLKVQYGLGFEYLASNTFGIKIFGEQNLPFDDTIDGVTHGKKDDYYWRFSLGVNAYFGKEKKTETKKIF